MSVKKIKIQEILEKYRVAGEISKGAKEIVRENCKPGANAYEICQKVENYIKSQNALPAFPTNISINNEAAHYSAEILDTRTVPENSIVKMDLGVHIDGYIVDTAITMNFNSDLEALSKSSLTALNRAIEAARPGVKVIELGKIIEKSIVEDGFQPVRNLSGHQIKRYNLHAGVSIPNCGPGYFEKDKNVLESGRIYAIEPFASTGKGWVTNGKTTNIFRFIGVLKKKHKPALVKAYNKYKAIVGVLPFSPRMIHDPKSGIEGKGNIMKDLQQLLQSRLIMGYPVLIEENPNAMVSQHEHTIRVTRDGCELLT